MMKINVGTHNPVKVRATRNVLEKIYTTVDIEGIEVDSGVRDQPIGLEETIQGAMKRARNAFLVWIYRWVLNPVYWLYLTVSPVSGFTVVCHLRWGTNLPGG